MGNYTFDVEKAAVLLTAVVNGFRFRIIQMLMVSERDVGSMSNELGLSQSALSQHLKKLRDAKIVATRRQNQKIYYSLVAPEAARIISTMKRLSFKE